MKVIEKSSKKVVIEVLLSEVEKSGFDQIWDGIRSSYAIENWKEESILQHNDGKILLITLTPKKRTELPPIS